MGKKGGADTVVLIISGRIARTDIPELCERARVHLEKKDDHLLVCDVSAVVDPDAVAVDALARLQLVARRLGGEVRLLRPAADLQELLDLMGLEGVVRETQVSGLEASGEPEEGEQPVGVEEESDPGDLVT